MQSSCLFIVTNLKPFLVTPKTSSHLFNKAGLQSQKFNMVPSESEWIAPCDQPGIEMQSQYYFLKGFWGLLLLPETKIELCYKDVHLANMCYLQ